MALASSSLRQIRCGCLEKISSSPPLRRYLRHIYDRDLSLTCRKKQTKVRLSLMKLNTGRLPRSRCSLGEPYLASSRKSVRLNRSRIPSGFQNLTSQMRTTVALSGRPRWAHLRMSPHWRRETMVSSSALNWYCQWDGWIHPILYAHDLKH